MDKIKTLFEKAGVKPELAQQICESLEAYRTSVKQKLEEDHKAKLDQAKKICVEETEAHKRELARRLQIFCEAKGAAIQAHLMKQAVIGESNASTKLRHIKDALTGVSATNGSSAVAADVRQLKIVKEERKKALEVANRQTQLAEKALRRNRELIKQISELTDRSRSVVKENRDQQRPTRRIDTGVRKTQAQPNTTRPTLVESQTRTSRQAQPQRTAVSNVGNIQEIAANVDEII